MLNFVVPKVTYEPSNKKNGNRMQHTQELQDYIESCYAEGATMREIGESLGCDNAANVIHKHTTRHQYRLEKKHIPTPRVVREGHHKQVVATENLLTYLEDRARVNYPVSHTAKELGVNDHTIKAIMVQNGIEMPRSPVKGINPNKKFVPRPKKKLGPGFDPAKLAKYIKKTPEGAPSSSIFGKKVKS